MKFPNVVVWVEYRMKSSPDERPRWRALRARVRQEDAEGYTYGQDLVRPTENYVDAVVSRCLVLLERFADVIVFEFAYEMHESRRVYRGGKIVFEKSA